MFSKDILKLRLFGNRTIDNDNHWLWTGDLDKDGYGYMYCGYVTVRVHRLSLYLFKDFDLDSNKQSLHTCNKRNCFNPDHLYEGTHIDNMKDRRLKFCKNGHPFIDENIYVNPVNGDRYCRICKNIKQNKRRKNAIKHYI